MIAAMSKVPWSSRKTKVFCLLLFIQHGHSGSCDRWFKWILEVYSRHSEHQTHPPPTITLPWQCWKSKIQARKSKDWPVSIRTIGIPQYNKCLLLLFAPQVYKLWYTKVSKGKCATWLIKYITAELEDTTTTTTTATTTTKDPITL